MVDKIAAGPKRPQIRQARFGGGWVPQGGEVYTVGMSIAVAPWHARFWQKAPDYMTTLLKIAPKTPALLVVSAIWVLSSQSTLPIPKGILGFDKLQHLLAYLSLAVSFVFWFPPAQRRFHRLRTFLLLSLVSSLYGVIDEIHQFYVPGRDCNVWDWIADTLGALLGAGIALLADRLALWRRAHG